MRPERTTGALGALLQALEDDERLMEEEPSFPVEVKREPANLGAPKPTGNRLVEQIACAMLKLRAQEGY